MDTFVIRRRQGWKNGDQLKATAAVSMKVGNDEMPDKVRWIRSYVVQEADGTLGTLCIYQAINEQAIRDHAARVGMPADEITMVVDTVVVRQDPVPQAAAAA